MKLSDFRGVFRKVDTELLRVENPFDDYYIVTLKPVTKIHWQSGEHGIFTLPGKSFKGKKWRAFSIASTADEGLIVIATRIGKHVSSYKRALLKMKVGEVVTLRGPFGGFTIKDDHSPVILMSTGVGIAPMRALAKSASKVKDRPVIILHADKDKYLFRQVFEELADENTSVTYEMLNSKAMMDEAVINYANKYKDKGYFYISGSKESIKSLTAILRINGIAKNRIINDPFVGY